MPATCSRSSPQVTSPRSRASDSWMDRDGRVVAAAEDVLGVGQPAPGNHSAPGISRRPRTRLYGRSALTSKKSQIEAQNASMSSTDHCQSSS